MTRNDLILRLAVALLILLAAVGPALASGGPYVVDDADVIAPGSSQLETWYLHRGAAADAFVLAPGTHQAGVEWSLFTIWTRLDGRMDTGIALQGKHLLRAVNSGGIGLAIAAGAGVEARAGRISEGFICLPGTYEPLTALRLHANLGAIYTRDGNLWSLFWGAAFDWQVSCRLNLLGEVFGDDLGGLGYQAGLRPSVISDVLHLDLTWARLLEDPDQNTWTLGLVWMF